jgi:hypothetical protein
VCGSDGCVSNVCDISGVCDRSDRHDSGDKRDGSGRCVTVTSLMAATGVWQ